MTIVPLSLVTPLAIEALLDRAFGPDRHNRTAYRLREGTATIPLLSFAALDATGTMVGSIQCWPVELLRDDGRRAAMAMVGPVAVEPAIQRGGIGQGLMNAMLGAADADATLGHDTLMLIGDPEYYGRFGFAADRTGRWRLPGPFERHRLLARGGSVADVAGVIGPRLRVDA